MKYVKFLLQVPGWYLYWDGGVKSDWTSVTIVNIIICVVNYKHPDIASWKGINGS